MMNVYFCTWVKSSVSGKTETGSELIQAKDKEEAKLNILKLNSIRNVNSTNVLIYNFSELCKKHNIDYSFNNIKSDKKKENTAPKKQIDDDIF